MDLIFVVKKPNKIGMKTLFLILISLSFEVAFGLTEMIESSGAGTSYIDPIHQMARVQIQSDFINPDISEKSFVCGTIRIDRKEVNGKLVPSAEIDNTRSCEGPSFQRCEGEGNKIAIYEKILEDGTVEIEKKETKDCKKIEKQTLKDPKYCKPNETPAMVMMLQNPTTCNNGQTCKKSPTPKTYTKNICLKNKGCGNTPNDSDIADKIKSCSPKNQVVVIKDATSNRSLVSSLKDNQQCGKTFGKKTISTGDKLWDKENKPEFQIKVSNTPGFFVGDHTSYFFDFNKKSWCIHFLPNNPNSQVTCDPRLNDITRSIGFRQNDIRKNKGVVKLGIDEKGNPTATIGYPQDEEFNYKPTLDESKPVLQVTLSNDKETGRSSLFELKNSFKSTTVLSKIEVSPTYSLGTRLSQAGACGTKSCINVPVEYYGRYRTVDTKNFCANQDSVDLTNSSEGQCYSCNGVTPGLCGDKTILITESGKRDTGKEIPNDPRLFASFQGVMKNLNACKADTSSTEPEGSSTTDK